ncbi:MAG: AAA family ATPase [Nitrolancea sp.]
MTQHDAELVRCICGTGRVLLLIGPSSVGKTTIARELQRSLPGAWLLAGVDLFWGMLDEAKLSDGTFRTDSDVMRRVTRGWHHAVAALAEEGNNVIADELWTHQWWLDDWQDVLNGITWWPVMLTARAEVLAVREAHRGDRPAGLAQFDHARPVDPADFDLVLDTSDLTAAESATAIANFIQQPRLES